jgi:hypothetical protein
MTLTFVSDLDLASSWKYTKKLADRRNIHLNFLKCHSYNPRNRHLAKKIIIFGISCYGNRKNMGAIEVNFEIFEFVRIQAIEGSGKFNPSHYLGGGKC